VPNLDLLLKQRPPQLAATPSSKRGSQVHLQANKIKSSKQGSGQSSRNGTELKTNTAGQRQLQSPLRTGGEKLGRGSLGGGKVLGTT